MCKSILVLTAILFQLGLCTAQKVVNFESDLNGKQLSIPHVCVGDSVWVDFSLKRQKGSLMSFNTTDPDLYIRFEDKVFGNEVLNLRKRNLGRLIFKRNSDKTLPYGGIEFKFTVNGKVIVEKYIVKKYAQIFNENYSGDPIILFKNDKCSANLILFEQAGTTTWVEITKNDKVVYKDGYMNSPVLEFDLDEFGVGNYDVKYYAHDEKIEFKLSYIKK